VSVGGKYGGFRYLNQCFSSINWAVTFANMMMGALGYWAAASENTTRPS
jgi:hypothetical protein